MTLVHETLSVEWTYDASPERLFSALSDPRARERWSVPPGAGLAALDKLVDELARPERESDQ
ncbi:MAG: hypothetical protein ACOH1E_04515 [Brevundimonas sp.]